MNTITEYRKQHKLTMLQMANEIGINAATLHRIEHNSGNETIRKVILWCKKKGVNPCDVFPPQASS